MNFSLTLPDGTVIVFDGTVFTVTATGGTPVTYSIPSTTPPTVVNVTEGEEIQIEETDAPTA